MDGRLGLSSYGYNTHDNVKNLRMAERGAVFKLAKTLSLEWRGILPRCRYSPNLNGDSATRHIVGETTCPDHTLREVGYTVDGKRYITHASPLDSPRTDGGDKGILKPDVHKVTSNDVFLVSGGGRGIAAALHKGACKH